MNQLYDGTPILIIDENSPPSYDSLLDKSTNNYEHSNYFFYSFISFFFCCSPFGLVSMYYAERANDAYYEKNFKKAEKKNHVAKTMILLAVLIGIILNFLIVCIVVTYY